MLEEALNDTKLENDRLSHNIAAMQALITSKQADLLKEREATGTRIRDSEEQHRQAAVEMQRVVNGEKCRAEDAVANQQETKERLVSTEETLRTLRASTKASLEAEAEKNAQMKVLPCFPPSAYLTRSFFMACQAALDQACADAAHAERYCKQLQDWDAALRAEANVIRVQLLHALESAVEIEHTGTDSRQERTITQAGAYLGLSRAVERILRTKFPLAGGENPTDRAALQLSQQQYCDEKSYLTIVPPG